MQAATPYWKEPGRQMTINEVFRRAAEDFPERCFLDFSGDKVSYRQFDEHVSALARGLRSLGVAHGRTVSAMLDNNIDALALWIAASRLGAIYVPVNTALKADFLRHQVADCGAEVVIAEAGYMERFAAIAGQLPKLKLLLCRDARATLPAGLPFKAGRLDDYRLAGGERIDEPVSPADITLIIYTAGTTGPSKGCMLPHHQMCNVGRLTIEHCSRTGDEVMWTPLPFFHINALGTTILSSAMTGGVAAISPRFSVSQFWDDVERANAVIATGLGTMLAFLAQAPDTPAMLRYRGKLRMMRGAPFPPDVLKVWRERFGVKEAGSAVYGTTETCNITGMPPGQFGPPGSSGRANDSYDVRLVDDNGMEVPQGEVGEIVVRPLAPNVMFKGYWNRPADTLKIWDNLWMHMGDLGRFDKDGFLYFVDRKKDSLRRRGENISSYELENTFLQHDEIEEVAVHAVRALSEDDIKVTAVRSAGSTLSEEALMRWCIERLPYFAVPRYVEFRAALPKNQVGRILKYELRDEGCTPGTWDLEKSGIKVARR